MYNENIYLFIEKIGIRDHNDIIIFLKNNFNIDIIKKYFKKFCYIYEHQNFLILIS
jgi:hypothetical protein